MKKNTVRRRPSKVVNLLFLLVGVLYFFVRIIGKYAGSFLGCAIVKKDKKVR